MSSNNEGSIASPAVPGHVTGSLDRRWATSITGIALFAALVGAIVIWAPTLGFYLAVVSALVVVHEAAHMVVARRCGLACSEFSVGFGPVVGSVHARGLDWSLRAIPAGGFVRILGPTETSEVPDSIPESATLRGTTRPRRVATIAAGPISNLVVAVILSAAAFSIVGTPTADGGRDRMGPVAAVSAGVGELSATASATLGGLGSLIAGADDYSRAVVDGERHADAPAGFMSPVGAADLLGRLSDPQLILRFAAIISVSLGVFNLLPFPPLDGGHLAVEAVNAIRSRLAGRRVNVSVRAQNVAATATLAFFALMTLAALRLDVAAGV